MDIYWILVALVFLVGVPIQPHWSKPRAKIYLLIVFVMLLIVSGFRAFSVGADTKEYVRVFYNIGNLNLMKGRYEIGFLRYVDILHRFSENPGILLIASSAVCIGTACVFTYKFSKNPILSMILYILLGSYFSQMNAMRQALALSLVEISFIVLLESNKVGKKALSACLILLATTFHTVAVVGVVPWILMIRSDNKGNRLNCITASKMLKSTIWIAGIAFIAYSVIMVVAVKLFPQYAGYFKGEWSDANYNASLFNTLIQLSFSIVGAIVFRNKKLNKNQRFAVIMLSLTIVFDVLSMRMEIWGRIAGMFSIYTYLLWVPEFTSEIYSVKNRTLLNVAIVLFSAAYMLTVLVFRPEWTWVVPYRFR